jgi:hypothetical protein
VREAADAAVAKNPALPRPRLFYNDYATDTISPLQGCYPRGGQAGHPAPLASQFHRVPTRAQLNLHAIY